MVTIHYVAEYGKQRQKPPVISRLEKDYLEDQWEDNIVASTAVAMQ
jgi:hypothetical protein